MDFIKITGIFGHSGSTEETSIYIDYKNSKIYAQNVMEYPVERIIGDKLEIDGKTYNAFKFDKKMICRDDVDIETSFLVKDYEEYCKNNTKKRQYFKDLFSGLEIGKPLVFFIKYNDPKIKSLQETMSFSTVGAKGIYTFNDIKKANTELLKEVAYANETIILRCFNVESVEFVNEVINQSSKEMIYNNNLVLNDIMEKYTKILNESKSNRLKLEDIRKETIKAFALQKTNYIQHKSYNNKIYTLQKNKKDSIKMWEKNNNELDIAYENKRNESIGKRLFGGKER